MNGYLVLNATGVKWNGFAMKPSLDRGPLPLGGPSCRRDWVPGMMSMRPRRTGRRAVNPGLDPTCLLWNGRASFSVFLLRRRTNSHSPSFFSSLFPRLLLQKTRRETRLSCQNLPLSPGILVTTLRSSKGVTEATMGDKAKSVSPQAKSPSPAALASSPPAASSPLAVDEVIPALLPSRRQYLH